MEFGLLLIRLVVGGLLAGHGIQKLFGRLGGYGLDGTAGYLESLGLRPGRRLAALAGLAELTGGTLLVIGFVTPVAAGFIGATMVVAARTAHVGKGLWIFNGGAEYALTVAVAALAVAVGGPGPFSVDGAIGLRFDAATGGAIGIVVAAIGALGVLSRRYSAESAAGSNGPSGASRMTDTATM